MFASFIAYVRRHHLALLALFVALGGTAYALENNSVRSRHIVDNQVKTGDIKTDTIAPADLGTLASEEQNAVNDVPADTIEIGPEVDVSVPGPGLVAVHIRADVRLFDDSGLQNCSVSIDTDETTPRPLILVTAEDDETSPWYSAPGTAEDGVGSGFAQDAGWILFEATPGARTFQVELVGGGSTCRFENVRLYVVPVG